MPVIKTDRESIIQKSIRLFKIHGYYSTTMATIGESCGLIKGSIYHHFKSKEDLALQCLKYIHEEFNKDIFSIANRKELSAKAKLRLLTEQVEHYFLNSEGGCLCGNFSLEISNNIPILKNEIIAYFTDWEKALATILKPELGDASARKQASQIVAATQGSIMLMRLYGNSDTFKLQNKAVLKLLN